MKRVRKIEKQKETHIHRVRDLYDNIHREREIDRQIYIYRERDREKYLN